MASNAKQHTKQDTRHNGKIRNMDDNAKNFGSVCEYTLVNNNISDIIDATIVKERKNDMALDISLTM